MEILDKNNIDSVNTAILGYPIVSKPAIILDENSGNYHNAGLFGLCLTQKCKDEKAKEQEAKYAREAANAQYQSSLLELLQSSESSASKKMPVALYVIAGLAVLGVFAVGYLMLVKSKKTKTQGV